jgi:hypothetical protein
MWRTGTGFSPKPYPRESNGYKAFLVSIPMGTKVSYPRSVIEEVSAETEDQVPLPSLGQIKPVGSVCVRPHEFFPLLFLFKKTNCSYGYLNCAFEFH